MSTESHTAVPALVGMRPGEHYCGIFRTDAEHRRVSIDFVRLGVERNEKMLYLVNLQTQEHLKATLMEAGIAVDALIEKGQLAILSAKDVYLADGVFEPQKMIDALGRETDAALAEGYAALRVTGEMTWALAGDPGSERLIEYEALLNAFYIEHPACYSICQYDKRHFDADTLIDVLHTHPRVLVGTEALDNTSMYFVPSDGFLGADRNNAILEARLANLEKNAA